MPQLNGKCLRLLIAIALVSDRLAGMAVAVIVHIADVLLRHSIVVVTHIADALTLQAIRVIGVRANVLTGYTIVVVGVVPDALGTHPVAAVHHVANVLAGLSLCPNANEHKRQSGDNDSQCILPGPPPTVVQSQRLCNRVSV